MYYIFAVVSLFLICVCWYINDLHCVDVITCISLIPAMYGVKPLICIVLVLLYNCSISDQYSGKWHNPQNRIKYKDSCELGGVVDGISILGCRHSKCGRRVHAHHRV